MASRHGGRTARCPGRASRRRGVARGAKQFRVGIGGRRRGEEGCRRFVQFFPIFPAARAPPPSPRARGHAGGAPGSFFSISPFSLPFLSRLRPAGVAPRRTSSPPNQSAIPRRQGHRTKRGRRVPRRGPPLDIQRRSRDDAAAGIRRVHAPVSAQRAPARPACPCHRPAAGRAVLFMWPAEATN